MTAVEWLIDQIINNNGVNQKTFDQAKQMEAQQKGFSLSDMQNCWGIAYMNGVCEDNELHENMSFPDLIDSIIKSKEL